MPRPGPRPYECVKRAWHSDRHQPMRGSIIQQIFKVVCENHSAITKKNREWQEKLPIVVLKTEEIMYSKANSEAEYMDLGTLWDRVNDAIDTIIRKDETAETGELLPPCVEVRASRGQRHNNPRNYLSPRPQESASTASNVLDGNINGQVSNLLLLRSGNQSNVVKSMSGSSVPLVSGSNRHVLQDINNPNAPCSTSYSQANNQILPSQSKTSFNMGSVYPLYYSTNFQPETSRLGFQEPQNSKDIIVGTPIFAPIKKTAELGCMRLLVPSEAYEVPPNRTKQADFGEKNAEGPEIECDLSLRLGLFADSILCRDKGSTRGTEKMDPSISEGSKVSVTSSSRAKEFSLFSGETANDPSGLHLGKYDLEGEGQSIESFLRKRKLPFPDRNRTMGNFSGK